MRLIDADEFLKKLDHSPLIQDSMRKAFDQMPTIEPEQRWIPCSETVDIPEHEVLACDKYGEQIIGFLVYADDQWLCESTESMMYDPIAWMPLPEPYKER